MSVSCRKALLASTALLLALSFAIPAQAVTVTINGGDQAVGVDPAATPAINYVTNHTATVTDGILVTGTVTTGTNNFGILTLSGQTTVSGQVGTGTNELLTINAGALNAKTATFSGDVYAQTLNISGTGVVSLGGNLIAPTINYGADGTVTLASGKTITGAISTTTVNTGTLTLLGGTQSVSGAVGATGKALKLINVAAAAASTFSSTVFTQTLAFTGAGSTINLSGGFTGALSFATFDDVVVLGNNQNLTGTVDSGAVGAGTLTLSGGTQLVSGAVGSTSDLKVVNAAATGGASTFNSAVKSQTVNFTGTGTAVFNGLVTASTGVTYAGAATATFNAGLTGGLSFAGNNGTANLTSGTLTGAVSATAANTGTLTLTGTSAVTGTVGSGNALLTVNAAATGGASTFSSTVNAQTVNVTGTGTTVFNGLVTAGVGNVTYASTGTATFNAGLTGSVAFAGNNGAANLTSGTLTGTVSTTVANTGTLTLTGTSAVTGAVGSVSALLAVNTAANGAAATFSSTVNAQTINVTGTGTSTFNGLVTANAGAGNVAYAAAGTATFNAGLTGSVAFAGNNGTANLGGGTLTGTVSATAANTGTLTLTGTSAVTGAVGSGNALLAVNVAANGAAATFSSTVNAQTVNVTGTGTSTFNGLVTAGTGNVTYASTGTATFNAGLTGSVNFAGNNGTAALGGGTLTGTVSTTSANTGTLTLTGTSTVSGAVGSGNALLAVNAAAIGAVSTFSSTVNAQTINVTGTGTATFNAGLTGNVAFAANDGEVILASGQSLTGTANATVANTGTLTLSGGTQAVSGAIGATQALKVINAGATGAVSTFSGTVNAQTINVTGNGSAAFNDNVAGALVFLEATTGTATIADGKTMTGSINGTAGGVSDGNLVFSGSSSGITTIGDTGTLKSLTINGTGKTVTTSGNVLAADTTAVAANALNVTGTFGLGTGQQLKASVTDSTTYGHVTSTGAATINANSQLNLTVNTNVFIPVNTTFTIVDGTGGVGVSTLAAGKLTVNGANSGTTQTAVDHVMVYNQVVDASNLVIKLTHLPAATPNGSSVDTLLTVLGAGGDAALDAAQLYIQQSTSAAQMTSRLEALTPPADDGSVTSSIAAAAATQDIADIRMDALRSGDRSVTGISAGTSKMDAHMWIQGYGQIARQSNQVGVGGYSSGLTGAVTGIDTTTSNGRTVFGAALSYGMTRIDSTNANTTNTDVASYGINLYSSFDAGRYAFMMAQAGYTMNNVKQERHNVGGLGVTTKADFGAKQYSSKLALGVNYETRSRLTLTPTVSASYAHLSTDGYTETGGPALMVNGTGSNSLKMGGDLKLSALLRNRAGAEMKPFLHAGYTHDVLARKTETTSRFVGDPAQTLFLTTGAAPALNQFNTGGGVTYLGTANWALSASYDYSCRTGYAAHAGLLRATSNF